jgi:deazaflavin-dependent oxidoreductase (nitroreductase family)
VDLANVASEQFCYLTTSGRISGEPREIEIWFALEGSTLFMLAGGREKANWVRNIRKQPAVSVRIAGERLAAGARIVESEAVEDATARRLLVAKYQPGYSGDLGNWGRTALPVALDLQVRGSRTDD